jgi:hypothetical protein
MHMFVNDLILNACVKTTEMFICEKILANADIMVSNVLKLSQRFSTQWNLLCWKYKVLFWVQTQTQNPRIHKLLIFNQTLKIDTYEEKYIHSNWNTLGNRKCKYPR